MTPRSNAYTHFPHVSGLMYNKPPPLFFFSPSSVPLLVCLLSGKHPADTLSKESY